MNDLDLESRLKSVPVPERSEAYWDDFPARVRVQLRRESHGFATQNVWRPRLSWAAGMALALALVWIGERFHPLQTASDAITKHEQQFKVQVTRLKVGMQTLVFNPRGMGYLLTEAN